MRENFIKVALRMREARKAYKALQPYIQKAPGRQKPGGVDKLLGALGRPIAAGESVRALPAPPPWSFGPSFGETTGKIHTEDTIQSLRGAFPEKLKVTPGARTGHDLLSPDDKTITGILSDWNKLQPHEREMFNRMAVLHEGAEMRRQVPGGTFPTTALSHMHNPGVLLEENNMVAGLPSNYARLKALYKNMRAPEWQEVAQAFPAVGATPYGETRLSRHAIKRLLQRAPEIKLSYYQAGVSAALRDLEGRRD
jgi:hypothetical protein